KNLINQEAKFQSQLNDLSKQLSIRDAEATKLRFQMEELQRDVFAKSAGMDRLQAEVNAATKEADLIRQKIHHLETELENYRRRNADLAEEIQQQKDAYSNYELETQSKINELEGVIKNLRIRIETLENQIHELQTEKDQLQVKHAELQTQRDEERKKLAETLDATSKQKEEIERKWKEDFEKLRTVNILKEQELLDDFEWKLREVQQVCKKKLDDKDKTIEEKLQEATKDAQKKMSEAESMLEQVEILKSYEIEVQQLRGRTTEQERTLQQMRDQQAQMVEAEASLKHETKRLLNLIELEKENLQHMQRIHRQEILDKERKLKETLNQKRTEIAMYWEEKLLHECGRLKDELEQIHDEEKYNAMEAVRKEKEEEYKKRQNEWEQKLRDCLKEIQYLKKALDEKDEYYHDELISVRSKTDRDIMELRRLMDKIDMTHHDNYDKLVDQHEMDIEQLNYEHEKQIRLLEESWRNKVGDVSANLEEVKQQMEKENSQKIEMLIQQHRLELDSQWQNLVHQKEEAAQLIEKEYAAKCQALEEQFYTQQNSHGSREVELLKTIDSLKNELESKASALDDLQSNIDTLEGGVQVLNQEVAQQTAYANKVKNEADQKIRSLHETIARILEEREKEREAYRLKFMGSHKQSQETIEHLQRKCNCLTKLFEEVRQRYERRESRQEDLNIISDLKQVIAEQEKDLACINEEKRYFQMRLIQLERHLEQQSSIEEDDFEDAQSSSRTDHPQSSQSQVSSQPRSFFLPPIPNDPNFIPPSQNGPIFIPPTIPETEE
ncbi:LOW QUALITY PROTEIN: protein FAM184A-like, partial [Sitophilus oryzae]|uniref:LOW QUALITY PROTEIN: protein FAM184A-like n=1 Tax=Sitophilus oryzae TaxID=7048 RepID=A0A6J2YGK7_SITOR